MNIQEEANRRYPPDHTVDDPFGETGEAQSDPYGYEEYANRAFAAGAEWAVAQIAGRRDEFERMEAELDTLAGEKAQLAAVIEKVREAWAGWLIDDEAISEALSAVPSGVLAERDADNWDEGFDAAVSWSVSEPGVPRPKNPYREGKTHE